MFNRFSHHLKTMAGLNRQQMSSSSNQPKENSAQGQKLLPSSDFNLRPSPRNGNCFYHGLAEALGNKTVNELRGTLKTYVENNQAKLLDDPVFRQAGGVGKVLELLSSYSQWDGDQGDLVPHIAAQALGREIHILKKNENGDQYDLKQAIPARTDRLLGEDQSLSTGEVQSPIFFLHGKTDEGFEHYDLLEPKADRQSPYTANTSTNVGKAARASQTVQANSSNPLSEAKKSYLPAIESKLLDGKALSDASLEQLHGALNKLEEMFDRYDSAVTQIDSGDRKNRLTKRLNRRANPLTQARQTKHEIESDLGVGGQKNFGVTRRGGRQEALKAINVIHELIKSEVNQRQQQSEEIEPNFTGLMEQLSSKLQKPNFRHNAEQLKKDISAVSASAKNNAANPVQGPSSGATAPSKEEFEAHNHPLVRATEKYEPFMKNKLLGGVKLEDASPAQLRDGLKAFQRILNTYSEVNEQLDKGSWTKNNAMQKKLRAKKHEIENYIGDNTYRNLGIKHREGRRGAMKGMHLSFSRMATELEQRQLAGKMDNPAIAQECNELMGKISHKLDHPGFKVDSHKLQMDLAGVLSRKEVGVEKPALMKSFIDDAAGTLNVLSSEGKGANAKPWQSKKVDSIVSQVQSQLNTLKSTLNPSLTEAELADVGIKANKIIEQGYANIAKHADSQLTKGNLNKATAEALTTLRNTAYLAQQNHHSSGLAGTVTKARIEFEQSLPLHVRERAGTAPTPGIERSSATSVTAGVSAGFDVAKFGKAKISEDGKAVHPHGLRASIRGAYTGTRRQTASIGRANDGNLFSTNVTNTSHKVNFNGGVSLKTKAVQKALGEISVGATADVNGSRTKQTGSVALGSTAAAGFGSHHAPKLLNGQSAGTGIGRFSRLTGIDDTFGTRKLNRVSETALKLGYSNEDQVAAGFHALLGNDVETTYDRKGKGPLGEMFASTALQSKTVADGHQPKGVMSELFADPLWESRQYERVTWQGGASVNASATADAAGGIPFLPSFKLGAKAGRGGSISVADTNRIVRSPKLPHDMFNPGLNMSPRLSIQYVQEYFSQPTTADKTLAKPIADAMGFDNTADYFAAIASSFGEDGPQIGNVNSQQLTQRYNDFQRDVNLIDQFYLQPQDAIRQKQLPQVQAAIERINKNFGAQLPNINKGNVGELQVSDKKGYTENYQRFQDTSVAILGGFSAAAGAMKLMANESATNQEQKKTLAEAAESLLGSINDRFMPWNRKEMSNRATYVRQIVATPFSHSVTTNKTAEARVFHGRHGGEYNISGIVDNGAAAILSSNSPGVGFNVNQSKTTTTLPDTVTDPGQTGITRNTVTTHQKLTGPFRDFRNADTLTGKLRQALLQAATSKQEIDYLQTRTKTQAYTAKPDDENDNARQFTAYRSTTTREKRSVGANLGGSIPTGSPVKVNLGVGRTDDKNDYTLDGFTYGNDVGAMSIVGEKIFKDHKINMNDVAAQIAASQRDGGPPFDFIDRLDNRFAEGILGDKQYDHMSAILSKFRNAGFIEGTVDGQQGLQHPEITAEGMAVPASENQLHNSKGQPLDLSADKKYVDRSGFFGYAVARYDEGLIQDAYKHWQSYEQSFPNVAEIDRLLSKPVPPEMRHKDSEGKPIEQTHQQWLKSASMEQRKDFYQNNPDGKQMLLNYLKVLSFSASLNDVIFQNNSHQMMRDTEQVERVNDLFASPQDKVETVRLPLTQTEAQAILDDPERMNELLNNPIIYTDDGLIAKELPLPPTPAHTDHIQRDPIRREREERS